jgi:hypothetical protein
MVDFVLFFPFDCDRFGWRWQKPVNFVSFVGGEAVYMKYIMDP